MIAFVAALLFAPAAPVEVSPQLQQGLIALLEQQTEEVPGWPWQAGEPRAAPNLGGVIALSLLRAYELRPDPAAWVTLVQYAGHLRLAYGPESRLPFKADIELLARLSELGISEAAGPFARELFARVRGVSPTGRDEYRRIAAGRAALPEIIGYDLALSVRAALAVGERAYAEELADAALAEGRLRLTRPGDGFQVTSTGALLHALVLLARPQDAAAVAQAVGELVAAQDPDVGSWALNNTQASAYAVLGLQAAGGQAAARAADAGRRWLAARQLGSGSWAAYHDGLPEPFVGPVIPLAEAEALAALLAPSP